jgi:hypothetical protein
MAGVCSILLVLVLVLVLARRSGSGFGITNLEGIRGLVSQGTGASKLILSLSVIEDGLFVRI